MDEDQLPSVRGLLETSLYVADPPASACFYRDLLGFRIMSELPRLVAMDAGNAGVLLLFRRGATSEDVPTASGMVPGHEGEGRLHVAFAIAAREYEAWRDRIASSDRPILSEVAWPAGGKSVYFTDPDGNIVELATPGLWPNY